MIVLADKTSKDLGFSYHDFFEAWFSNLVLCIGEICADHTGKPEAVLEQLNRKDGYRQAQMGNGIQR